MKNERFKPPPPRYDNIYHARAALLDSLDGGDKPRILLDGHLFGSYHLKHAIEAEVESNQGSFIVSVESLEAYGYGASLEEAVDDCKSMIAEKYEHLLEHKKALSRHLRKVLDRLSHHISGGKDGKTGKDRA